MIVKSENYIYAASYVKTGHNYMNEKWTRFSIFDFDKKSQTGVSVTVLALGDVKIEDGDRIYFKDYNVGVKKYRGNQQVTIYAKSEDVVVVDRSTPFIEQEDLMDIFFGKEKNNV